MAGVIRLCVRGVVVMSSIGHAIAPVGVPAIEVGLG
jgi:hypothetical protein